MTRNNFHFFYIILLLTFGITLADAQTTQQPSATPLKSTPVSPVSFKHKDIGNPSIAGSVTTSAAGLDINAGGADIWGTKDEFHFAYLERTGDFDIVTRVESFSAANLYTKAGIMAREDLTAVCRHIFFQVFSDNNLRNKNNGGYEFQYRPMKDSLMKAIYPKNAAGNPEFPVKYPNVWIRLQRSGNDFTGYYSTDGKIWKPYTTYTLQLPPKVYLGLALTAHNTGHNASAKFRNISELKH
jgi:hypothetical protein